MQELVKLILCIFGIKNSFLNLFDLNYRIVPWNTILGIKFTGTFYSLLMLAAGMVFMLSTLL